MLDLTGMVLWGFAFAAWWGWSRALDTMPHMASGGHVRTFALTSAYLLVAIMLAVADRVVDLMLGV